MVWTGLLALYGCLFGLGVFWRNGGENDLFVGITLITIKSLFIAWFVFVLSYFTPFGLAMAPFFLVIGVASTFLLINGANERFSVPVQRNARICTRVSVVLATLSFGAVAIKASEMLGTTFLSWDALVSWNRWAIELSNNQYLPHPGTAYPIFFPAIWSMIYESQRNSDLWIIAKSSMSLLAIMMFMPLLHIILVQGVARFTVLFIPMLVGVFLNDELYSGYMDYPSSLIGFTSVLLGILALRAKSITEAETLLLGSILAGTIAVLTKQHGIFAFSISSLIIVGLIFLKRVRRVTSLIFMFPLAAFAVYAVIYYLAGGTVSVWSNLDTLKELSLQRGSGMSKLVFAYGRLETLLPGPIWVGLAIGAALNCLGNRLENLLAALLLLAAGLGFFIYTQCCSYDSRNGAWLIGILTLASYLGYETLFTFLARRNIALAQWLDSPTSVSEQWIPRKARKWILASAVLSSVVLTVEWPLSRLQEYQRQVLRHQIDPVLQTLIQKYPDLFSEAELVITPAQTYRYHPDIGARVKVCMKTTPACLAGAQPTKTLITVMFWSEDAVSEAYVRSLIEKGILRSVEEMKHMHLFQLVKPLE